MTSIKNDRPTTAPRTTSTSGPAPTPEPEMSTVDELDGVTNLEALEGMSLDKGTTFESAKNIRSTIVTMTTKKELDELVTAPPADVDAVTRLTNAVLEDMKPGESAVIGAKAEGDVELSVGLEVGIEVSRREDGKYVVKLEQEAFVGVGGSVGLGTTGQETKVGVKGGMTGATQVSFVVDTAAEAAKVVASAAAGAAAAQLIPVPGIATTAAGAMAIAVNHDKVSEVGVALGFSVEAELELDVLAELKAKASGAVSAGLVFVPPDEAVLELKASAGASGETSMGDHELMLGSAGGEGEITVRVPLGKVAGAELLADPKTQKALLEQVGRKPAGTTMSFEGSLAGSVAVAGANAKLTKAVDGNRLDNLFASGGWQVQVSAEIGGKVGGKIGPMTAEVTVQRNATVYETTAATPEAAAQQVNAHAADIAAKVKKANP